MKSPLKRLHFPEQCCRLVLCGIGYHSFCILVYESKYVCMDGQKSFQTTLSPTHTKHTYTQTHTKHTYTQTHT